MREKFLVVFSALSFLISLCRSERCYAQATVRAADHVNSISYTFSSSPSLAIVDVLNEEGQFDAAERILLRKLKYENDDIRQVIQLNNQLVFVKAKQFLAASQAATQHVAIGAQILKSAEAASANVSSLEIDQPVPSVSDVKLFLEFGKYRALSELARYLTAAKIATVGNKALDVAAQKSINDQIEALNDLQGRVERRGSELSKQTTSVSLQSWINEFLRLINEIYLLKIDLLAMHMDQIPAENEADRVSIATSLRTEIANVSAKLGSSQSDSPRLNLLRARAAASVGEIDKAMELLKRVSNSPDESLREQSRLMAVDIMLTQHTNESIQKARSVLNEILESSSSVSPALALAAFRHNLINGAAAQASGATNFETSEDLARSLQIRLSAAELTKQKETLGKRFGDYWRLRAEALMLHNAARSDTSTTNSGSEIFDAQVQQDLLAGRYEQAFERLNGIEQQANDQNDINKAFTTARQRNGLLYTLLRNKEKELGVNEQTVAARLNIAEKCRDAALKYRNHSLAHEELLQSIQIAQGATSKTDAKQNKQVLDFIVQTIEPNVAIFANATSLTTVMHTISVVLASNGNYAAVKHLWEQLAIAQTDTNLVATSRRYRAIFRTLERIKESGTLDTSYKNDAADINKTAISKEFANDDQSIRMVCRSIYWSDQILNQPLNIDNQKFVIHWLDSLIKLQASLEKSGQTIPSPTFDKASQIDVYEELVYNSLRQKIVAEYCLNRNGKLPSDIPSASVKAEATADVMVKIIFSALAGIDARGESAASILNGKAEVGLDRFKAYANANMSTENKLWFGRLLTAATRRREAINVLTRLVNAEKVGSPNWLRVKADILLALKNGDQKEVALKDFEKSLDMAPSASDAWRKTLKGVLEQ